MIFGYCRLSTIEQSRGQTLEAQISLLEQWGIDKVYYDLESGRKTDREQFNQMLDDARKTAAQGEAVIIRVARHDRWARNVVYSLQTIEELESLGVVLESRDR
ncbi:MAG: recombinase family protein, partial [Cyanobacteria bacterium P01_F01_bin.86]